MVGCASVQAMQARAQNAAKTLQSAAAVRQHKLEEHTAGLGSRRRALLSMSHDQQAGRFAGGLRPLKAGTCTPLRHLMHLSSRKIPEGHGCMELAPMPMGATGPAMPPMQASSDGRRKGEA